ncbi:unnamed protein product [Lampetra planeri]
MAENLKKRNPLVTSSDDEDTATGTRPPATTWQDAAILNIAVERRPCAGISEAPRGVHPAAKQLFCGKEPQGEDADAASPPSTREAVATGEAAVAAAAWAGAPPSWLVCETPEQSREDAALTVRFLRGQGAAGVHAREKLPNWSHVGPPFWLAWEIAGMRSAHGAAILSTRGRQYGKAGSDDPEGEESGSRGKEDISGSPEEIGVSCWSEEAGPRWVAAAPSATWLMGLRHTVGQRCAERGGVERLTGERVRGRVRGGADGRACAACERSVRGTREETLIGANGGACAARERRRWSLVRTSGV